MLRFYAISYIPKFPKIFPFPRPKIFQTMTQDMRKHGGQALRNQVRRYDRSVMDS